MRSVQQWLSDYGVSHTVAMNKRLHWVGIPLIVFSLFGLLWAIPIPRSVVWLYANVATIVAILIIVYYSLLSLRLAIGMALVFALMLGMLGFIDIILGKGFVVSMVAVFVIGWVFQFVGHMIEGKKPSFFEDLQFLLIGPLWLLADLYRRAGIRIE